MGNENNPAFSRNGFSNVLGGLTAEIPKIKLPEVTKEILDKQARLAGLSTSEYVRKLLMVRAHGVDMLLSLEKEQLAVVAGMGNEEGDQ